MKVLITGSKGFIGKNLLARLAYEKDIKLFEFDIENKSCDLEHFLNEAEIIFHLAGVNRPEREEEFKTGNVELTELICNYLERLGRKPTVVFSSSIQAGVENPYGSSKKAAEDILINWADKGNGRAVIFRLKNVFGKWCRPNYNSVVATFCHNISHNLPIVINDTERVLELVYIDDVVEGFIHIINELRNSQERYHDVKSYEFREIPRYFSITVGELANKLKRFHESRKKLLVPDFSDDFERFLYATFISYYDLEDISISLENKVDERGTLAEALKSREFGQIFVLRINPGQTRGNHFHHTKIEKFLVLEGQAHLKLKNIDNGTSAVFRLSSDRLQLIEIPPGYSHSIENIGSTPVIVLVWANEIFNQARPDTFYYEVKS